MPVKRFWFYNKMVDRLLAEEDLRQINLLASVTSKEAYGKTVTHLEKQMGTIVVLIPENSKFTVEAGQDPAFDRGGFEALKADILRFQR